MPPLIVTYELTNGPRTKEHKGVLEVIKSADRWIKLFESSYAIDTDMLPQQLYDKLLPFLDSHDRVLITALKKPFWGLHAQDVIDWLEDRLPST